MPVPKRFIVLFAVSLVVGIALLAINYLGIQPGELRTPIELAEVIVFILVVAYFVFRSAVQPPEAGTPTTGIVFGVLAVIMAFPRLYLLGLTFVLGPAALAVGLKNRERGEETKGTVAMALGAAALAIAVTVAILDTV